LYILAGFNAKAAGEQLVLYKGQHPRRPGEFWKRQYLKEQKYGTVETRPGTSLGVDWEA
jgi:hypothetical protein